MKKIIDKLAQQHFLEKDELHHLIAFRNEESRRLLLDSALQARRQYFGNTIFIRGLIEISNICKNDCLYCGIRHSNHNAARYRLSHEDIMECCAEGYSLGFRTFVLQGGEDPSFTDDRLVRLISDIKSHYPDTALTLSLGEKSYNSYKLYRNAGADRYLLRHETANPGHYAKLHPSSMSHRNRMECLYNLKNLGYQTGIGFMVGSPFQTIDNIVEDLLFIADFKPAMVGIGPFIPHHETPFAKQKPGTAELTTYLLAIIRLLLPKVLLPATTALDTIANDGREKGILAGANVIMPNLSPANVRQKYMIYDNKLSSGAEAAEYLNVLKEDMNNIGFQIITDRGDAPS